MITSRLRQLDAWIFSGIDTRQIAALRIGLSAILLVRLCRHDFITLSRQPEGLYRPLSYMHALNKMPATNTTRALLVIVFVSAFAALIGYRSRWSLPIATGGALVLFGMTTSSGKVMHNDALLLLCLLPLAFGTTDRVWSMTAWRNNRVHPQLASGWPWRVVLLLVCGAYFFAGLAKLTHSGIEWVFSDNMRWILYANSDARSVPNQLSLFIADHPWLARTSGASIIALELTFPLVLWRPKLRWIFVPAVIAMHTFTWLTLQLDYSAMAAVVIVSMIYWPAAIRRLNLRAGRARNLQFAAETRRP